MRKKRDIMDNRPKDGKKSHGKTIFLVILLTLFFVSFATTAYIIINANQLTFKAEPVDSEELLKQIEELEGKLAEKNELIEELTLRNSGSGGSSGSPTPSPTKKPQTSQGGGSSTAKPTATPSAKPSETPSKSAEPSESPSASPSKEPSEAPTETPFTPPTPVPIPTATPSLLPPSDGR